MEKNINSKNVTIDNNSTEENVMKKSNLNELCTKINDSSKKLLFARRHLIRTFLYDDVEKFKGEKLGIASGYCMLVNSICGEINVKEKISFELLDAEFSKMFESLTELEFIAIVTRYGLEDGMMHSFKDVKKALERKLKGDYSMIEHIFLNRGLRALKTDVNINRLKELFADPTFDKKSIKSWDFSDRTVRILTNNDIQTIDDICMLSEEELRGMYGVGNVTFNEIVSKLEQIDRSLGDIEPDYDDDFD